MSNKAEIKIVCLISSSRGLVNVPLHGNQLRDENMKWWRQVHFAFLVHGEAITTSILLVYFYKNGNCHIDSKDAEIWNYSKTCVKWPLSKRPQVGFQDQLSLNAGQTYSWILQGEHSAILTTFIKLSFVIKIFVLSILEWPFYTCFIVG